MTEPLHKVRVATTADAVAVSEVLAASYGELLTADYDAAVLARALPLMSKANPVLLESGRYYVAETADGRIIGAGGWSVERPGSTEVIDGLAHVRHFATDPRWIGRGVATAILTRCSNDAAAAGARTMEAYSTLSAVNFYQALGFVTVGTFDVQSGAWPDPVICPYEAECGRPLRQLLR